MARFLLAATAALALFACVMLAGTLMERSASAVQVTPEQAVQLAQATTQRAQIEAETERLRIEAWTERWLIACGTAVVSATLFVTGQALRLRRVRLELEDTPQWDVETTARRLP